MQVGTGIRVLSRSRTPTPGRARPAGNALGGWRNPEESGEIGDRVDDDSRLPQRLRPELSGLDEHPVRAGRLRPGDVRGDVVTHDDDVGK